uniref:sn-1-specific diacylglycerol lipase n=1 Tax=Chromera velia CCMP2878 TaxID=1169474 RepID=A0A0G4FNJ9_9ALVE|eukprot:Cvel_17724.t1-p1 / transcript=Cvel_17724.t1 / gene=Cvel_17724 / organism=Chromera_velia_CCMP2878 / gene_product=Sn1-specific diacylglycerol lipase beta, putative / transcript_product=Sn1-specific diacylglycerol lipase beta, putative / location=Cvel_scaffold1431:26084-33460(+) / protein_length=985 / sequence_SO=supercontig / SO=protein_coding / is_pseudo=false
MTTGGLNDTPGGNEDVLLEHEPDLQVYAAHPSPAPEEEQRWARKRLESIFRWFDICCCYRLPWQKKPVSEDLRNRDLMLSTMATLMINFSKGAEISRVDLVLALALLRALRKFEERQAALSLVFLDLPDDSRITSAVSKMQTELQILKDREREEKDLRRHGEGDREGYQQEHDGPARPLLQDFPDSPGNDERSSLLHRSQAESASAETEKAVLVVQRSPAEIAPSRARSSPESPSKTPWRALRARRSIHLHQQKHEKSVRSFVSRVADMMGRGERPPSIDALEEQMGRSEAEGDDCRSTDGRDDDLHRAYDALERGEQYGEELNLSSGERVMVSKRDLGALRNVRVGLEIFALQMPAREVVSAVAYYSNFMLASYGWKLFTFMHPFRGALWTAAWWCTQLCTKRDPYRAAFLSLAGLSENDLVASNFVSHPFKPSFFLCVDRRSRSVVLVCRGSLEPHDVITDALATAHKFEDGYTHGGFLAGTEWVLSMICEPLRKTVEENPGYRVVFIGHSLGAATAILAAKRLRPLYPELHVFAFGCPALLDPVQAEACEEFVTTLCNGFDIVPRASFKSARHLRAHICQIAAAVAKEATKRQSQAASVVGRESRKGASVLSSASAQAGAVGVPMRSISPSERVERGEGGAERRVEVAVEREGDGGGGRTAGEAREKDDHTMLGVSKQMWLLLKAPFLKEEEFLDRAREKGYHAVRQRTDNAPFDSRMPARAMGGRLERDSDPSQEERERERETQMQMPNDDRQKGEKRRSTAGSGTHVGGGVLGKGDSWEVLSENLEEMEREAEREMLLSEDQKMEVPGFLLQLTTVQPHMPTRHPVRPPRCPHCCKWHRGGCLPCRLLHRFYAGPAGCCCCRCPCFIEKSTLSARADDARPRASCCCLFGSGGVQSDDGTCCGCCEEPELRLTSPDRGEFDEIQVAARMFIDHFPDTYHVKITDLFHRMEDGQLRNARDLPQEELLRRIAKTIDYFQGKN